MKNTKQSETSIQGPATLAFELLEYGKFCSVSNGAIEPLAEHQTLGFTAAFPQTLRAKCTPVNLGLAESLTEMERLDLLINYGHGTVFRTIQEGNDTYYICYRIGQRFEGRGRYYTVATYLTSVTPLDPLQTYDAMPPIRGLTRAEADNLRPIGLEPSGREEIHDGVDELAGRVTYAFRRGKAVHVKLPDERKFFQLCGAVWKKLDQGQQRVFSCGWNVSPYVGARLLVSFGPKIPTPELAVVIDPDKPAPQAPKKPTVISLDGLFQDGQRFLKNATAIPEPTTGFLDLAVSFLFSSFGREFAERFPEILDDPQYHGAAVMHLIRFGPTEQAALYATVEPILTRDETRLAVWLKLQASCRNKVPGWGRECETAPIKLARRLQNAIAKGVLPELIVNLSTEELAASSELECKFKVMSDVLPLRPVQSAAAFHAGLLLANEVLPLWYEVWIIKNKESVAAILAEGGEAKALRSLGKLCGPDGWQTLPLWEAIALRIPTATMHIHTLNISNEEKKAFSECLVNLWFQDMDFVEEWLRTLGSNTEAAFLNHYLRGWTALLSEVLADTKSEFDREVSRRRRIVQRLRELCDSDKIPKECAEEMWFGYCATDARLIKKLTNGWDGPLANRTRIYAACAEQLARDVAKGILLVQRDKELARLSTRCHPQIKFTLNELLQNRELHDALESLLTAWPKCEPFDEWMGLNAGLVGVLLLEMGRIDSAAWEGFIYVCPDPLSDIFRTIGTHGSPPALDSQDILKRQNGNIWPLRLGRYVQRKWATSSTSGKKLLEEWARWIGPQFIGEVGLRFAVGMQIESKDLVKHAQCASMLSTMEISHQINPDLSLIKAALVGRFESEDEPGEAEIDMAISALNNNIGFRMAGLRWTDLWENSKAPWQRLFVLEAASLEYFEVRATDLISFKRHVSWLNRILSVHSHRAYSQTTERMLQRLRLVSCAFQYYDYKSDIWSNDLASTHLIGAFRKVPLRHYADDAVFRAVLDNYFPDLKKGGWAPGVADALTHFVGDYVGDVENYGPAMDMVDRLFLRQWVYPQKEIRLQIFGAIRDPHRRNKRPAIEWTQLQNQFLEAETPIVGLYIDSNLRDLIERAAMQLTDRG